MKNQFGPYLYFDGMLQKKTFGDRSFTVILAAAYSAGGLIGPEHNGITVLDDNNREILLDRHIEISSGYHGPSDEQKWAFDQVLSMDWADFSRYVRQNPRYRGTAEDINSGMEPKAGELLDLWITNRKVPDPTGPDIRTEGMVDGHNSSETDYAFPDKTREEMIVSLANHSGYVPMNRNNGGFVLSWDIKAHGIINGKADGYEHDSQFDDRWDEYLEENYSHIFDQACSDALSTYYEGSFTAFGDETVRAKFNTNGRQGGHLILSDWSGPTPKGWSSCQMAFENREGFIEFLKEMEPADLAKLYALVQTVDHDTSNPTAAVNYSVAFIRQTMEEQWAAEMAPAI